MPIPLGLMDSILPYGYFSVALLTVVAAVVIGAFWAGWGLLAPAKQKKGVAPGVVRSPAETGENGGAFARTASVPAADEKKQEVALTKMAPLPAPKVRGKDAVAADLYAAPLLGVAMEVHEPMAGVGVALLCGEEERVPRFMAPPTAESEGQEDDPYEMAPAAEENEGAVTGKAPPPAAATVEGKDPLSRDLSAASPALKVDKELHQSLEEDGVGFVSGEERAPSDMVPSTAERDGEEGASTETVPILAAKDNKDATTETAPTPAARKEEQAHPVEGEKKVHELAEEAGVPSLVAGEWRDVPVEEDIAVFDAGTRNKADWPTRTEPAEKLKIQELTLEELKAYDGSVAERPLLLAIKGNVYDVSKSRVLYGPGCQNELFGGRDVTRALALMSFELDDLTGKIDDLKKDELEVLGDWEQKFMEKYPTVGRLVAVKSCDGKQLS